MRVRDWVLALGAVALVAGCGNQMLTGPVDLHPQGTEDASSRLDAQTGTFSGTYDAGVSPPACTSNCCNFVSPNCPPTLPGLGTPCGTPSAGACEYGDDPHSACNTLVQCTASGWTLHPSLESVVNCPTPASICPPTFAGAVDGGADCPYSESNDQCVYPEGYCTCVGVWFCFRSPSTCPATRPLAGTPCDPDGGGCQTWGDPCGLDGMQCRCGIWILPICLLGDG
jgi:hypothetical protein